MSDGKIENSKKRKREIESHDEAHLRLKSMLMMMIKSENDLFSSTRPVLSPQSFFMLPLCAFSLSHPNNKSLNEMKNCFGMKLLFMEDEMIYLNGFSWDSSHSVCEQTNEKIFRACEETFQ